MVRQVRLSFDDWKTWIIASHDEQPPRNKSFWLVVLAWVVFLVSIVCVFGIFIDFGIGWGVASVIISFIVDIIFVSVAVATRNEYDEACKADKDLKEDSFSLWGSKMERMSKKILEVRELPPPATGGSSGWQFYTDSGAHSFNDDVYAAYLNAGKPSKVQVEIRSNWK